MQINNYQDKLWKSFQPTLTICIKHITDEIDYRRHCIQRENVQWLLHEIRRTTEPGKWAAFLKALHFAGNNGFFIYIVFSVIFYLDVYVML